MTEGPDSSPHIKIKGIREGLLVSLSEGDWSVLEQALLDHIEKQGDFLKGAQLTLDIGNHKLKAAELGHLRDILSDRGVILRAVLSHSPSTEIAAQDLGLATRLSKPRPDRATRPLTTNLTGDEAIFVLRTLRSGHNIVSLKPHPLDHFFCTVIFYFTKILIVTNLKNHKSPMFL